MGWGIAGNAGQKEEGVLSAWQGGEILNKNAFGFFIGPIRQHSLSFCTNKITHQNQNASGKCSIHAVLLQFHS